MVEESSKKVSKEELGRKLDREDGEPRPDEAEILGATLKAVETVDKAEEALNERLSADKQRQTAKEIKEETNQIIDSFVESAKKGSSDK